MSAWATFLTTIQNEKEVTLVGPLYHQRHTPLMPTIYVDGGTRYRAAGGWVAEAHAATHPLAAAAARPFPVVSVGDGDSAGSSLDELLPADKDYSDLSFVLRSLPPSIREVTLLGFLGGRRDHELANLGEVNAFLQTRPGFARADLVGPVGDRVIAFNRGSLELHIQSVFSVFVFQASGIEVSGLCKYPLSAETMLSPLSSRTLSNEGYGKVIITSSNPCFIFIEKSG
ncbi:MAG: hypothetical protein KF799_01430 [Bdellovibrionales bacterium]|nr:hypothetical protein [Bdellovibrionales bacterium]